MFGVGHWLVVWSGPEHCFGENVVESLVPALVCKKIV